MRGSGRRQVNRQLNLDSTTELRRASSLRILAAKRGYVSKSIHTHKAYWQWLKHVFPRPLFSSQTTPGWLFRVSFEMQSDISRQRRRECAHTEFQYPTRQEERVRHTDRGWPTEPIVGPNTFGRSPTHRYSG